MYSILGAGLSGLSVADHLAKKGIAFIIYESKSHGGGHVHSEYVDGFTWDQGPHISFTKNAYVENYFACNVNNNFCEFSATPINYYKGTWIPHPAQANMYAVPEPLRSESIAALKKVREISGKNFVANNYKEWLTYTFGKTFAENFPEVYTVKYWTTHPENLTTDWIGNRVFFPNVTDMVESAEGPLKKQAHYLAQFRYPLNGGFYSYIKKVEKNLPVSYNKKLQHISFDKKELLFSDDERVTYEKLVSTLPLPQLILNSDAPKHIKACAKKLRCSQVLLINVVVNHTTPVANQWVYVYDRDMYATRINFTELLSPNNGQPGKSGIQVEVYFSDYRPLTEAIEQIEKRVLSELITMKLILNIEAVESTHSKFLNWANVIFDIERRENQNLILEYLESKGLIREADDVEPMTNWDYKTELLQPLGDIILAGRFAQWKYYWTDDCVLRALFIAECLTK